MTPRVLVLGCGAVGGIFAARLARAAEVSVLDAWAEHVEAIAARGLRVTVRDARASCRPTGGRPPCNQSGLVPEGGDGAVSETIALGEAHAHQGSMKQDIDRGRPTEIDTLTGALVAEADRAAVPVPALRTVYRLVKAIEHDAVARGEGRR